ncbi:MAG: hypothetical protein ACK4UN_02765 [Limisphaerales bacterium]
MKLLLSLLVLITFSHHLQAFESWQSSLARMPLKTNVVQLTKANTIPLMLESFQQDHTVKAVIFMPGATDELYFFDRVQAGVTNDTPTLLDAVNALTDQTFIEATFRSPYLLLHSREDPVEPFYTIQDESTATRIKKKKFRKHLLSNDRDWHALQPYLEFYADTTVLPPKGSAASNHFFRHSYAAWNLTAWEALEATALAGKTTFTVQRRKVVFEGDKRFRERPIVPANFD